MTGDKIIEEAVRLVDEGVSVTLPVNGTSMLPFIVGGRESVVLQKPGQLQVGDVVLAWASPGRWVVHRIIRIDGNRVTLMATHVMDGKGEIHYLYNRWRKSAARTWFWLRPIRRYLLAIYKRL